MDQTPPPPPLPQLSQGQGVSGERWMLGIVACALFMQNLDGTVIATALPRMAHAFGVDPVHMNLALTAYLFSVALFVPASGWMADRFGTRTVFRAAIAVFTAGSALCGASHGFWELVASRVLQGAGGAMMLPVGRLILLRSIPKARMVGAMAWVTMPGLLGPVIGPPVGGFIVTYFSWRWIFYINLPIGLLGGLLTGWLIPQLREPNPGPFDLPGLILSGAALAGLLGVLEFAGGGVLPPSVVVALAALGLTASLAYAAHARHQVRKLLDFSLMRLPSFAVSVISGSLFRVGVGATPFLLPMMIQIGFGKSPAQSGLITFASAIGAIGMKPATQYFLRRFGFRNLLIFNGILCALGPAAYAAFRPSWPIALIYAVLLVTGFMRSLQFTAYNTIAYADVPPDRMSSATTLYSALQQISLTIAIPISAFVLQLTRAGHVRPELSDFSAAFLTIAAIAMLAGPTALLLPSGAGAELAGRDQGES